MATGRYPADASFEFGDYRLDLFQEALFRGKELLPCGPRACRVLRVLVEAAGKLVTWSELARAAWGVEAVTRSAQSFQLNALRNCLSDDALAPRFIKTHPGRGLQFIAPVRKMVPTGASAASYEQGRHLYHKSTPEAVLKAIECFETVIERRHEFVADAHAAIAESYVLLGTFAHQIMPARRAMTLSRDAARRALKLDEGIAEAHSALGSVAALYAWHWPGARAHFEKAIALPGNRLAKPMIRSWYALCLAARGEAKAARQEIDRARNEFPSSFVLAALSGRIAYLARDSALALREHAEGVMLEESMFLNYLLRGHAERGAGQLDAAISSFTKAVELSQGNAVCLSELAHLNALMGQAAIAKQILHTLEARSETTYISPHLLAHICMGLNQERDMFRYLEASYKERCAYMVFLTSDPVYDQIRTNRRFSRMASRIAFAR